MKTQMFVPVALAILLAQGCATITSSEMQSLSLTTQAADGRPVEKATCALRNDKGSWTVESPGVVPVRRSGDDLVVECRKDGHPDGILRAVSRAAIGMFGNIIFGGVIGAVVDHSKGTGYDYPNELPVRMGASIVVDRREPPVAANTDEPPAAGLNSPQTGPGGRANSGETVVR